MQSSPPIATPKAFLGHQPGEAFTPQHAVVAYFRHVADRSPRVELRTYGRTPGGRPLLLALVAPAERIADLEEELNRLKRLGDPRLSDESEAGALAATARPIAWLSYNVHGNEPSPTETALLLLHRLATGEDEDTLALLDGVTVVIDPCLNPDGRERYVQWYRDRRGSSADPEPDALEHQEPWPGGRSNHWQFDLNRDWAFATQPETQARLPWMAHWPPQVHVDFHEMGFEQDYFFFPPAPPVHALLDHPHLKAFGELYGRGNARAFDRRGERYHTAEAFDLFYPGYGDSGPSFRGAVGMTYEQGGHSRGGEAVRRRDGRVLTLAQRTANHLSSSLATLRTSAEHRKRLLLGWRSFRAAAIADARGELSRAVILPDPRRDAGTRTVARTLALHGIELSELREAWTDSRARPAFGGAPAPQRFPAGALVVDLAQPLGRLARTLLEPQASLREIDFYDVAAWALPLAAGVPSHEVMTLGGAKLQRLEAVPTAARGRLVGEDARVGWLVRHDEHSELRTLPALLEAGLRVRIAASAFTQGGVRFAPGTLFLPRAEQPEGVALDAELRELVATHGLVAHAAPTGFTEAGIDLGSDRMRVVRHPRIAVLGGPGVRTASYGAARFLLDVQLDLRPSVLPLSGIGNAKLERFTAIVVPEASLGREAKRTLAAYAQAGGVVIALGRSAFALTGEGGPAAARAAPAPKAAPAPSTPRWSADRDAARRLRNQPGSALAIELDPSHPLAFASPARGALLVRGARAFDPAGPGEHVGRFLPEPFLAGYADDAAKARLADRSWLVVEREGQGRLVLFAHDPNFRGTWRGLSRPFVNAVLLLSDRILPR